MKIFLPNLTPACIRLDDIKEQLDRPTLRDNRYLELEYHQQLKELHTAMEAVRFNLESAVEDDPWTVALPSVEEITKNMLTTLERSSVEEVKPGVLSGLLSMLGGSRT